MDPSLERMRLVKDEAIPLCVELDGTLTPVNILHESLLSLVRKAPWALLFLPAWVRGGRAYMKCKLTALANLDAGQLPYNSILIEWLASERAAGRRLILVTSAESGVANNIAARMGLFDEVLSSKEDRNLSPETVPSVLIERFGERGFDYVGSGKTRKETWAAARKAIVVGEVSRIERAGRITRLERGFPAPDSGLLVWLRAIRAHQWAKNTLVFLPALLAHEILKPPILTHAAIAFLAFSLCASSIYLINDLLDLPADREHSRKRTRAFASGRLSARSGLLASLLLLCAAGCLALLAGTQFALVLLGYYVLTWAYSLRLKSIALVDVVTLAGLYTIRIIAGSAATGVPSSFWLLAFSVFMFLSLAIVKRYAEIGETRDTGATAIHGRSYAPRDLPILMSFGVASGYCAVVVIALYLNSSESMILYRHAKPLWLICPLLLYWISHIWLLTARGQMDADPVVFALCDRVSLGVLAVLIVIVLAAI
jgi:4-hydroxybenzoate polyprenyltransferase